MKTTKHLGARHGAAVRARIETAKTRTRVTATRCVEQGKQVAGYFAGFAQGLLRSPNA